MIKHPFTIEENSLATEILSQMNKKQITNVCVYKKEIREKLLEFFTFILLLKI